MKNFVYMMLVSAAAGMTTPETTKAAAPDWEKEEFNGEASKEFPPIPGL